MTLSSLHVYMPGRHQCLAPLLSWIPCCEAYIPHTKLYGSECYLVNVSHGYESLHPLVNDVPWPIITWTTCLLNMQYLQLTPECSPAWYHVIMKCTGRRCTSAICTGRPVQAPCVQGAEYKPHMYRAPSTSAVCTGRPVQAPCVQDAEYKRRVYRTPSTSAVCTGCRVQAPCVQDAQYKPHVYRVPSTSAMCTLYSTCN